ncbi:NAD(P)/FAD-dependent oxidoreductase [Streptomyces sp. NPDC050610]|uniref:NAD(P)/FAD-dependent oxidoreductase n=1 Tax=Streptomyces sp. NPDC050610 TaxID=3157097 RepID=UPI00342D9EB8
MSQYDVIVVGARCAGAPLAMLLARAGRSVLLLDRAEFPSDTLSTHWILRGGIELLSSWGLLDALANSGCPPIERLSVDLGDMVLSGTPLSYGAPATTYAPRRHVLDALLVRAARAAGAEVREGCAVRDVLWQGDTVVGVTGRDRRGDAFTGLARVVVGADGRDSTVARAVAAPMTRDRGALASTLYAYWAHLPVDGARTVVRPGRGVAMWPTHDGLTVVALTLPRPEFLAHHTGAERLYLRSLERLPEVAGRLRGAERTGRVRAAGRVPNFFRQAHGPGWALAGDAGQHKDPIGAHGITDAFTDADHLSRALGQGLAGRTPMARALARYAARRDAGRGATFEFICRQASLAPLDDDFAGLLRASAKDESLRQDLLGVFAGSLRIEEFFTPARIRRHAPDAAGRLFPDRT